MNIKFKKVKDELECQLAELLKSLTEENWRYLYRVGFKDNSANLFRIEISGSTDKDTFDRLQIGGDCYRSNLDCIVFERDYYSRSFYLNEPPIKNVARERIPLESLLTIYYRDEYHFEFKSDIWLNFLINKFGNEYILLALEHRKRYLEEAVSGWGRAITQRQNEIANMQSSLKDAIEAKRRSELTLQEVEAEILKIKPNGCGVD